MVFMMYINSSNPHMHAQRLQRQSRSDTQRGRSQRSLSRSSVRSASARHNYSGSTRMAASRWCRMSSSHRRGRAGRSGGTAWSLLRRCRLPLGVRAPSSSPSHPPAACSAHWPCDAGEAAGEAAGEGDAAAAPCNRRASGDRFTGPRRSWRALAGLRRGVERQCRPRQGRSGANEAHGGAQRGAAAGDCTRLDSVLGPAAAAGSESPLQPLAVASASTRRCGRT